MLNKCNYTCKIYIFSTRHTRYITHVYVLQTNQYVKRILQTNFFKEEMKSPMNNFPDDFPIHTMADEELGQVDTHTMVALRVHFT